MAIELCPGCGEPHNADIPHRPVEWAAGEGCLCCEAIMAARENERTP